MVDELESLSLERTHHLRDSPKVGVKRALQKVLFPAPLDRRNRLMPRVTSNEMSRAAHRARYRNYA